MTGLFLLITSGGGPAIARQEQDIYSSKGISFLHAIILVQNRIRIYLCKKQRMLLYMKRLSTCQVAKAVIVELSRENVRSQAEQILREQRAERVKRNLGKAAEFTQHLWRLKKKYLLEENLEVKRQEQEVFSKVKGLSKDVPHSVTDAVVISDLQVLYMQSQYILYYCIHNGNIPLATPAYCSHRNDKHLYSRYSRRTGSAAFLGHALSWYRRSCHCFNEG